MLVKKRDGSLEEFNPNKILDSIRQAAMAVELKDGEVQDKAKQVRDLTRKLIASGFDPDDAADMAESQFDGYIEDGEYTEYDVKEAEEVLEMVTDSLDELGEYVVESDLIQDFVEKALMMSDHFKTAKEYIVHSSNRERIREMNTPLMKSFENLTFGNSKNVEKKRENANIDGDSAMGTMLKYGSESAKKFNLMYLVPPDQSEAHSNGDIHIHDLDFMALTQTCIVDNTKLVIQSDDGEIRTVEAREFDRFLEEIEVDEVKPIDGLRILSKGKFVKIKNCVRHSSDGKRIIEIKTDFGKITVTDEHKIPVVTSNGEVEIKAKDIHIGDKLHIDSCSNRAPNQSYINLIELFGPNPNIIIYNSQYVIDEIKSDGVWKDFCSSIGYGDRETSIRYGKTRMTLADYYAHVRPYIRLDESELQLAYRRTRGDESINAVLELTKELGKFIGYMISEGSVSVHKSIKQASPEKKACFTNYSEELIQDFNGCASKVFNNVVLRDRYTKGRHTGTHLSGYLAYELFHGPFCTKNSTGDISLPTWMYSANKEFLSGFLGALIDGDGHIVDNASGTLSNVVYSTASERLAYDLQQLLLLNGIKSHIRVDSTKGTIATFGDKTSIRNYDINKIVISSDTNKIVWIDSFKIKESTGYNLLKEDDNEELAEVIGIDVIDYNGYVYDFETENHYFSAIDLEKLFTGGFNTGHGFLREPGEIRSYAALACISVQSNQNDQHDVA